MRGAFLILASLTLAACALPQGEPGAYPGRYQPLRVYVSPLESGTAGFYVNRPAYAAMFAITPGAGTSLVYPAPGLGSRDGFVYGGMHSIPRLPIRRFANLETYSPGLRTPGPTFFFVIASEQPLDLSRFGGFGMGLRSALGTHFASYSAYTAMERLADLTLPLDAPEGTWASDVYVYWPDVIYERPAENRVLVRCNGYQMYVPAAFVAQVQATLCAADQADQPGQPARPDSAGADQPAKRRPAPRQAEVRDRVRSSSQLDEDAPRAGPERRPRVRDAQGTRRVGEDGRPVRRPGVEGAPSGKSPRGGTAGRPAKPAPRETPAQPRAQDRPTAPAAPPAVSAPAPSPPPASEPARRPQPRESCDNCRTN